MLIGDPHLWVVEERHTIGAGAGTGGVYTGCMGLLGAFGGVKGTGEGSVSCPVAGDEGLESGTSRRSGGGVVTGAIVVIGGGVTGVSCGKSIGSSTLGRCSLPRP